MKKKYKAALIGCGDYVRWLIDDLNNSRRFGVSATYDLDRQKSEKRARELHAVPAESAEAIWNDPEIDIVMIFTPPWGRIGLFKRAVESGKHIITTKPLAPNLEEALALQEIVGDRVECAVFYGRTGNPAVETLKRIFDGGEIGKLALYKEDWFHHFPQWNNWATDPEKNGGPFMDAMIHNLNKAVYLTDDEVADFTFFSENHAQQLPCNDTEFLKVDFRKGASAYLFITWAADLEVFSLTGNEREHIGISHMITDRGWYVTEEGGDGKPSIRARKEGEVKTWEIHPLPHTPFDDFILSMEAGTPQNCNLDMAVKDIEILHRAMRQQQPKA
jgi:predicted dehydrogenase